MAVLTAAAALAVLVPLYRRENPADGAGSAAIYRDQLQTLEAEVKRGAIAPAEAEAARAEIGRRLIRAEHEEKGEGRANSPGRLKLASLLAVGLLPLAALGLYLYLGSPGVPDDPLAARLAGPPNPADIAGLLARVETHLQQNPNDGAGWELVAPVYARLGRTEDAARAFGNAARLLPPTADRQANYGEALIMAADGPPPPEALAAFDAALKIDPTSVKARFLRAFVLGQTGRAPEAIVAWQDLLKDAQAGAPWVPAAQQALARLQGSAPPPPAAPAAQPGPSDADVAAAANLSPDQRMAMISGMVQNLADRLAREPNDPEGWTQLIRSYAVLGRTEDARAAFEKAKTSLAGNQEQLAALDGLARSLKLIQ